MPHIAALNNPGKKMNKLMKRALAEMGKATENYSLRLTRVGVINDAISDIKNIKVTHLVMRSGHDFTKICAVFENVWTRYHLQATAGRSLAEWKNASSRKKAISLALVYTIMEKTMLDNFVQTLFVGAPDELRVGGKLWKFAQNLVRMLAQDT